jgi:uncharacterized protein (TIGR03067 family)
VLIGESRIGESAIEIDNRGIGFSGGEMVRAVGFVAAMFLAGLVQQPELSKELQALQGTWVTTKLNGVAIQPTEPQVWLVIEGNKYSQVVDGKTNERGEIRIDASKTPMAITLFITEGDDKNKAQFGVMRQDGESLTIKLNAPAEPTRPTDFALAEGYLVAVFQRKPKGLATGKFD